MTIDELQKALAALPDDWREKPISDCPWIFWGEKLIMANGCKQPIYWNGTQWLPFETRQA